uniref:Uncharacterized protein n=1 Tax=Monodon monoceros TaxID=40151 RepID=A0A8C6CAL5_MONMO
LKLIFFQKWQLMKKFNFMKQLANQTVARAEKTEVLCEDLLQFKLCMDIVQSMYHHPHKSLMVCFQGQCGTDVFN